MDRRCDAEVWRIFRDDKEKISLKKDKEKILQLINELKVLDYEFETKLLDALIDVNFQKFYN